LADAERAEPVAKKRSDLPVRVASAVVMVAVAGTAFWLGGWVLSSFVLLVVFGVMAEWTQLVLAFAQGTVLRGLWLVGGVIYLGIATYTALVLLAPADFMWTLPVVIVSVIGVDVGAYFAGRTFGGPKIAPSISPSKTWSGLCGGILGAATAYLLMDWHVSPSIGDGYVALKWGIVVATVAQAGDFFESWMKRRADVKDSGNLIPGHGGLFDRADGLIAVLFAIGVYTLVSTMVH